MDLKVTCAVFCLLAAVAASPVIDSNTGNLDNSVHAGPKDKLEETVLKKLNAECTSREISACMVLKMITLFKHLLKKSSIEIGDVEITKTSAEVVTEETSRSLNDIENMSEEAQISQVVADKIWNFVQTRSLKWKIMDEADLVVSSSSDKDGGLNLGFSLRPNKNFDEARKKKNNMVGGIMALAAMKIGLLKALAFKALALLVGKALLVSKLALVLATIIGLKKLFSQEKHVTYEVVAQPSHEHHEHHDHGFSSGGGGGGGGGGGYESHGGWGRNFEAQSLAYKAQIPPN